MMHIPAAHEAEEQQQAGGAGQESKLGTEGSLQQIMLGFSRASTATLSRSLK